MLGYVPELLLSPALKPHPETTPLSASFGVLRQPLKRDVDVGLVLAADAVHAHLALPHVLQADEPAHTHGEGGEGVFTRAQTCTRSLVLMLLS